MDYKEFDKKPEKFTRWEVFSLGVKKNYKAFLLLGLLFALAIVPVATFRFMTVLHKAEMSVAVSLGEIDERVAYLSVNSFENIFWASSLALALPVAIVLAGMAKVSKMVAWREPVPVKESFGEGVKENGIKFSLLCIFNVFMLWLCNFVSNANPGNALWKYLPFATYLVVVLPISFWFVAVTAMYRDKLLRLAINSFKLAVKTYPQTLLFVVASLCPLLLTLIPFIYVHIIVQVLYMFLVPFIVLGWTHFTNKALDKYVNASLFPDLVDRGLL